MIQELFSFFSPNFLLHNAFWGSVAVGIFCPLIGVYLMLRRMALLGVALPQISAAGISFAFFLEGMGVSWSLHAGEANDRFLALAGSLVFTLAALLFLAYLERRGEGTTESRLGAVYAMACAAAILFVCAHPAGTIEVLGMLQGEIVSVTTGDLRLLLGACALVAVTLLLFNHRFLLVSFDRDFARVVGRNVAVWNLLLFGLIGLAVSMSVLIVGPMPTFAFLIIPPLAARRWCKRMLSFLLLSSALGGLAGLTGFYLSYHWDLPLGPADIAMASAFLGGSLLFKKTVVSVKNWA